ncbi:MAG: hypothetical protein JKY65_19050 [Planctomycetes bacterium]|nr:hypothetical protein [Planctomycetota bacterium]
MSHTLPTSLAPGQTATVEVVIQNTGTTTWESDGDQDYKLGAVGDQDPFHTEGRAHLPKGTKILPQATATFRFVLTAPRKAGRYTTDWRMVQEGVQWFGETIAREIEVRAER